MSAAALVSMEFRQGLTSKLWRARAAAVTGMHDPCVSFSGFIVMSMQQLTPQLWHAGAAAVAGMVPGLTPEAMLSARAVTTGYPGAQAAMHATSVAGAWQEFRV